MKIKRILAAFLSVLMIVSCLIISSSAVSSDLPFSDVKESHWFYNQVKFVYEKKLMSGGGDGTFKPLDKLTRGMFVTILGQLAGAEKSTTSIFPDVDPSKASHWFAGYVGWAYDAGIVSGYSNGNFGPNDNITREQIAICIAKYVSYMGINLPRENTAPAVFADADKTHSWAASYVETLRRAGIFNGNTAGELNPLGDITRAEAATVIMNVILAQQKAWQGYSPDPEEDGFAVYGAKYLYENATSFSGGLGYTLVDNGSDIPYLSSFVDKEYASGHATPANSAGICTTVFEDMVLAQTPVVKIAYKYEGYDEPDTLEGFYTINPCMNDWSRIYSNYYCDENFTFVSGNDDGEYRTVTFDMTALLEKHSKVDDRFDMSHILALPFDSDYEGDGCFNIAYIGFFEDQKSADSFEAEVLSDYLNGYYMSASTNISDLTDETKEHYDDLLGQRIDEILSSESELTPEMIKANGGTCYYISSVNGDDSNKGTSPEEAWKTPNALYKDYGHFRRFIPKEGDGVFLERGSVWYPETYNDTQKTCFSAENGVSFGAYGDPSKPKPTVTCALDFTDSNNVGNWKATEWDNIWVMDEIDEDHAYELGDKCDIGYMIFNDGEAFGIKILESTSSPENGYVGFGEGRVTKDYGLNTPDGKLYYVVDTTRPWENPGTALRNNYEYLYDADEGAIYLYWNEGNPADSFEEIVISRNGYAFLGKNDIRIDNIAIKYSATWGAFLGNKLASGGCQNIQVTNCEFGYVGGSITSIESGIEINGECNNIVMRGNYCHDIGDGPLSIQGGLEIPGEPTYFQNIEIHDNVIVACGNGIELWNNTGTYLIDENGIAQNKIINASIHDNIMAYIGYGVCEWQGDETAKYGNRKLGEFLCTGYELENCQLHDNVFMYGAGDIGISYFSSDTQKRGWELDNNVYILNTEYMRICTRRDSFNRTWQSNLSNYGIYVEIPLEERYLTYMASLGIGNTDAYYFYYGTTPEQEQKCYFMTGTLAHKLHK